MLALGFAAWAVATPAFEPQSVGRAAGVAGAYMVLVVAGFPADAGEPWQRGARMACAGLIFFAANALAEWLLDAAGWIACAWRPSSPASFTSAGPSLPPSASGAAWAGSRPSETPEAVPFLNRRLARHLAASSPAAYAQALAGGGNAGMVETRGEGAGLAAGEGRWPPERVARRGVGSGVSR